MNARHGDDHGVNLTKLRIGERLRVLEDYPTPPNCTSPYAPIWINQIVRRREGA